MTEARATRINWAAFIVAGVALLDRFHAATYLFGAMLAVAAVKMARGGGGDEGRDGRDSRLVRAVGRILPATGRLHGQCRPVEIRLALYQIAVV